MLGLLLVDHGSRRAATHAQLVDMAARVGRLVPPGTQIAIAHLEISPPSIAEGLAQLCANGCDEVRVLPYFLSDGRHSQEDIPSQVRAALADHPLVRWRIAPALGPDDLLATLLLRRAGLRLEILRPSLTVSP